MINRGTKVTNRVKEALRNRLKTSSCFSPAAVNYALQKLDSMQIYVCGIGNANSPYLQKSDAKCIMEYVNNDNAAFNKTLNAIDW